MGDLADSSTEAKSRRLSFKGLGAKVTSQMLGQVGEKALAPSGASVVGQEFKPDPVALGQPALSVLDVVAVVQHATPEFSYLRQTVRTNAAAVVPEGSVKLTSVYTVNKVPNTLAVVALLSKHLSLSLLAAHGPEATRALLQRTILDAKCGQ